MPLRRNNRVKFAARRDDGDACMPIQYRTKSNVERQRDFQAAHPGYDRRRKARQRASSGRGAALLMAQLQAKATAEQTHTAETTIQIPATKPPLMLPAPAENPLLAEVEALRAKLAHEAVCHPEVLRGI
jgi:hypothetical protein